MTDTQKVAESTQFKFSGSDFPRYDISDRQLVVFKAEKVEGDLPAGLTTKDCKSEYCVLSRSETESQWLVFKDSGRIIGSFLKGTSKRFDWLDPYYVMVRDTYQSYFMEKAAAFAVRSEDGNRQSLINYGDFIGKDTLINDQRIGDFNSDGFADIALSVCTDEKCEQVKKYILYQEPNYLTDNFGAEGDTFRIAVSEYVVSGDGLSADSFDMLKGLSEYVNATVDSTLRFHNLHVTDFIKGIFKEYQGDRKLITLKKFAYLVQKYKDDPKLIDLICTWHLRIEPSRYLDDILAISDRFDDPEKVSGLLRIYVNALRWGEGSMYRERISPAMTLRLLSDLVIMGERLTSEQITFLLPSFSYDGAFRGKRHIIDIVNGLDEILRNTSDEKLFSKLYNYFYRRGSVSVELFRKYKQLLSFNFYPIELDLMKLDKAGLSSEDAMLLYEKFNITRFGRYHPSMLRHVLEMAKDPNYKKDLPLVFILVAKKDDSELFYWGDRFKYDPKVRVVLMEYENGKEQVAAFHKVKDDYGIPDTVFITSHGRPGHIDGSEEVASLKGIFGDKPIQVIINACFGADGEDQSTAQQYANALSASVHAAKGREGLIGLTLAVDDGIAKLDPLYFEVDHFGFNSGGYIFKPKKVLKEPKDKTTIMMGF